MAVESSSNPQRAVVPVVASDEESAQADHPEQNESVATASEAAAMRDQLASLQRVVLEPAQIPSLTVRVGCVAESANNPAHWRTKCWWS